MKKCMFICVCSLSIQVTITMDNSKDSEPNHKIRINQKAYQQMKKLFEQQLKNKELEKQKKEVENQLKKQKQENQVENQLKKQKQENQELKIKITRQKLFRGKKTPRTAGRRRPFRRTRTSRR